MAELFDERLSLRRLTVALRRRDWRMFEHGLAKLDAELNRGSPFRALSEWQALARAATEASGLPEELLAALSAAMGRLLSSEAVVPVVSSVGDEPDEDAPPAPIAVVSAWKNSLSAPAVKLALREWLESDRRDAGRATLAAALEAGDDLPALVDRANLAQAAAATGLSLDTAWTSSLSAGLRRAIARESRGPELGDLLALADGAPLSVLTTEPGFAWEKHYADYGVAWQRAEAIEQGPHRLVKLAGSLDWFHCTACGFMLEASPGPGGVPEIVSVACASCGAPAWPLVAPSGESPFFPRALRSVWAYGGRLLREAPTWVLVAPPAPGGDPVLAFVLAQLGPGKRVIVITDEVHHEAWRIHLAAHPGVTAVTSGGPASEVLGFLLNGGTPEPAARQTPALALSSAAKKKPRR